MLADQEYCCDECWCDIFNFNAVYLSGAFFEDGERRNIFGTDYNITYHQISYDDLTGELDTTANYSLKGGTSWLLCKFFS